MPIFCWNNLSASRLGQQDTVWMQGRCSSTCSGRLQRRGYAAGLWQPDAGDVEHVQRPHLPYYYPAGRYRKTAPSRHGSKAPAVHPHRAVTEAAHAETGITSIGIALRWGPPHCSAVEAPCLPQSLASLAMGGSSSTRLENVTAWKERKSQRHSVMQGILGSTPWNALVFLTLYFQLIGMSDFAASALMALFLGGAYPGAWPRPQWHMRGGGVGLGVQNRGPDAVQASGLQAAV